LAQTRLEVQKALDLRLTALLNQRETFI